MPPPPKALIGFLRPYDPAVRDIALKLRDVVLRELAPCHENIYDAYSAVAIGYGPSDRIKDGICHIAVYTKYVNLGFNRGTLLPDPHDLMKGTGTWTRHITMKTPADVARPEVREYLRAALEESKADPVPGEKRPKLKGVVSTVKSIYARKRRPGAPKVGRSVKAR
jgi:hypothetical protein